MQQQLITEANKQKVSDILGHNDFICFFQWILPKNDLVSMRIILSDNTINKSKSLQSAGKADWSIEKIEDELVRMFINMLKEEKVN